MRAPRQEATAPLAPWGFALTSAVFVNQLLKQSTQALSRYADLHERLTGVERTLHQFSAGLGRTPIGSTQISELLPVAPVAQAASDVTTYKTVTLRNGAHFQVALDMGRTDPIAEAVAAGHTWFLDDLYLLLDLVRPGVTVLDIGGHIGTFALAAAALGGRVLCIEAAPDNVRLIRASVARNSFDQMLVVHGAATDYEGTIEFFPNGPWGTVANPIAARTSSVIYAHRVEPVAVPALTVDALLAGLQWEQVDLVKIDVEGSEVAAIAGMVRLLSQPEGPLVLYESNASALPMFNETPASLTRALARFGYRAYAIEPGQLRPMETGELRPECVLNCLAVKGSPPAPPNWPVSGPRSEEEMILRIVSASRSPWPHDRAYLARALASADAHILADSRVKAVLARLRLDADEEVREAAGWCDSAAHQRAVGMQGRP